MTPDNRHHLGFALLTSIACHMLAGLLISPSPNQAGQIPGILAQKIQIISLPTRKTFSTTSLSRKDKSTGELGQTESQGKQSSLRNIEEPSPVQNEIEFSPLAYLPVEALDSRPEVTLDVPIDPANLRDFMDGGSMNLILWINNTGSIDKITVLQSDLSGEIQTRLVKHFYGMKFRPGIKDGFAVASMLKIETKILPIDPPPLKARPRELEN